MRAAAPRTTQLLGISTGHAGQLLVTAGQNIERLRNDGAFAAPSVWPAAPSSFSGAPVAAHVHAASSRAAQSCSAPPKGTTTGAPGPVSFRPGRYLRTVVKDARRRFERLPAASVAETVAR